MIGRQHFIWHAWGNKQINGRLVAAGGHLDRAVFLDTGEESEDPQLLAVSDMT